MDNILRLRALRLNLTYPVLKNYITWPKRDFESAILNRDELKQNGGVYDLMFEQMTLNLTATRKLLRVDTKYVTILRHPLAQLKSLFHFRQLATKLNIVAKDPVAEFLSNPAKYEMTDMIDGVNVSWTRNFQFQFFGIDNVDLSKVDSDRHITKKVGEIFDFVLINEYYDESLVVLRRIMNWTFEDIVYLTNRKQSYGYKHMSYSSDKMAKHREWSNIDYTLYDYFTKILLEYLKDVTIIQDLQYFKQLNFQIQTFCKNTIKYISAYRYGHMTQSLLMDKLDTRFDRSMDFKAKDCLILSLSPEIFYRRKWSSYMNSTRIEDLKLRRLREIFQREENTYIYGVLPLEMFLQDSGLEVPLLWGIG